MLNIKIQTMKKIILSVAFIAVSAFASMAQKWVYVDTDYILKNIPEYNAAQQELDKLSIQWQQEIESKYNEIDKLYKAYQAEQILLTEDMRKKRENEIIAKEKEAKDLQKSKFGVDGELFQKRQDLVKPIQDKVYTAIKEMAVKGAYAAVFDKSSDLTMLYVDAKYDKSDAVLSAMGYKSGGTTNK